MTLAGYAAAKATWDDPVEPQWNAVLRKHGAKYSHMKEMSSPPKGAFKGWTDERVEALLLDLTHLMAKLRRTDLKAISCTVDLESHKTASREIAGLISPECICADFCVTSLYENLAADPASLDDNLQHSCPRQL